MTLYLDIDGVLNPVDYSTLDFDYLRPKDENDYLWHLALIDTRRCLALVDIIDEYEVDKIAVCSTWQKNFSLRELQYLFAVKGFPEIAEKMVRCTDLGYFVERDFSDFVEESAKLNRRELEILTDIIERNVQTYIILDDDVHNLKYNLLNELKAKYEAHQRH